MSSLISGYEYDIFISYRQKDNKHDGWVTEFVNNLKGELESTFKEEISVYFDINPHDGLLETHDVDESLKEKLKCLIFIPIISQTYCDPKSFAWEHEFKAFIEQASNDRFGLKIKLPNGNVASRVLPIRIYDLDNADIKLCESVLSGVLRGVEFIYTEPGVNRPLRSNEEDSQANLNHTIYRNQINKVANSIKEIIQGLALKPAKAVEEQANVKVSLKEVKANEVKELNEKPAKAGKIKFLIPIAILALLIAAGIFAYPKLFKRNTLERLRASGERISIAVMPFQNMTNDTTWNIWQEGIQDMIITSLSNSPEELIVRQTESINNLIKNRGFSNNSSITLSVATKISQKLNANVFINGTIKRAGPTLRLNAQIIESKTEEILKSFEINGPANEEKFFQITDSLKQMIKDYLIISKLRSDDSPYYRDITTTKSAEAFKYFTYANKIFFEQVDNSTAGNLYLKVLEIDSTFVPAAIRLMFTYYNRGLLEDAKKWSLKIYERKDQMPIKLRLIVLRSYAIINETPYEQIKYLKQLQEIDEQEPSIYYDLGWTYDKLHQYDKAIPNLEKSLKIYRKWDSKPVWVWNYVVLGKAYHKTNQLRKEKKLYKKAEQDFPEDIFLIPREAILALTEGDTAMANSYIGNYISILKRNSLSEAVISTSLAQIYSEAEILNKSEEYYRKSLSLEPESSDIMNNLAYFLIDKDRNINEGMELIDAALKLGPNNYNFLHTKGWGLYKQGKLQEAFDTLQKSWDLRRHIAVNKYEALLHFGEQYAVYYHEAFLHLETAKKAIEGQK